MRYVKAIRSTVAALLAGGLLFLSGCGGKTTAPDTIRIGVCLYQQDDTFISTLVQDLELMARDREQALGVKINLSVADGRGSQAAQNEQVDRFLTQGYDAICVNIVDRTAAAVIIDKAQAADVPVLFFNREPVKEDLRRWDEAYYVGSPADQAGRLQGEIVRAAWRDQSAALDRNGDGVLQYGMLEGEPGHQDTLLRTEYCVKVLSQANVTMEKLVSATANWQRGQANTQVQRWLSQYSDQLEVIFCNNDDMALGAIDACLDAGMAVEDLPFIVGVDATPPALEAVAAGTLKGTVQNDAKGQAESLLDLFCALALDQDPAQAVPLKDGKYVWLSYRSVTKENLSDFLPQSGT